MSDSEKKSSTEDLGSSRGSTTCGIEQDFAYCVTINDVPVRVAKYGMPIFYRSQDKALSDAIHHGNVGDTVRVFHIALGVVDEDKFLFHPSLRENRLVLGRDKPLRPSSAPHEVNNA